MQPGHNATVPDEPRELLVERVKSYDPAVDERKLRLAFDFAREHHQEQIRASGEPFFLHPIAVANILCDMKLDWQSVATALLHDTVEDTEATYFDVERRFGKEIADLVDGVTKLSMIELTDEVSSSAENFRKLFLAMSKDIRVLMVKLGDRLHNMRTLNFVKPEKQLRKSRETLEIYAPLAERIGMEVLKGELQDLAFRYVDPAAFETITGRLKAAIDDAGELQQAVQSELAEKLRESGVEAEVSGRIKSPYSVYLKMQSKSVEFEQLSDIIAFRILVARDEDCYAALGILHAAYPMVPGRFKDYLSNPKSNGYKSLHTGVVGPRRQKIEVQIRTHEMHEFNENGVAAHWTYKQGKARDATSYNVVRRLLDLLETADGAEEFLENTKMEMYPDQVFVFSPKGRLITLPVGATGVDFAYQVHTGVGNTCVGIKVNGRMRPLATVLRNGDQVEVLTSKNATPSPDWENFVATGKARAAIRKYIRNQEGEQYVSLGRKMLDRLSQAEGRSLNDKALEKILGTFGKAEVEDLVRDIGAGHIGTREVLHAVYPDLKTRQRELTRNADVPMEIRRSIPQPDSHKLSLRGLIPGMAVHYARCCHPLPGERIVGIVTTGKGVTVHTIECDTLERFSDEPERWLDVAWDSDELENASFVGRLHVVTLNNKGSLAEITHVISRNDGDIINLRFAVRSTDFFEMRVDVQVNSLRQLNLIIAALRANSHVTEVARARG